MKEIIIKRINELRNEIICINSLKRLTTDHRYVRNMAYKQLCYNEDLFQDVFQEAPCKYVATRKIEIQEFEYEQYGI